jgi:hypothetical protein
VLTESLGKSLSGEHFKISSDGAGGSDLTLNERASAGAADHLTRNKLSNYGVISKTQAAGVSSERLEARLSSAKLFHLAGGNATLNADDEFLSASLASATNLKTSAMPFVATTGIAGNDSIIGMAAQQKLTGWFGADTLAGSIGLRDLFQNTAAELNAHTIKHFGGTAFIDIPYPAREGASVAYDGYASNGGLRFGNGGLSAKFTFVSGSGLAQSLFHESVAGHAGTDIAPP